MRNKTEFEEKSFRTITLSATKGIKAVIGRPKGKSTTLIRKYLFSLKNGWTMKKAKDWIKKHKESGRRIDFGLSKSQIEVLAPMSIVKDTRWLIEGYATVGSFNRNGYHISHEGLKENIDEFMKNPVVLYMHDHTQPIGTVVELNFDKYGIFVKAEISKTAKWVWDLIQDGVLKAFSIGFMVNAVEKICVEDDRCFMSVTEGELIELSVVSVPAVRGSYFRVIERNHMGKQNVDLGVSGSYIPITANITSDTSDKSWTSGTGTTWEINPDWYWDDTPSPWVPDYQPWTPLEPGDQVILYPTVTFEESWFMSQYEDGYWHEEVEKWARENGIDLQKAKWTRAFINSLPDSAFAVIEDSENKRTRHLPHHTSDDNLDLPHLRNAMARVNQIIPVTQSVTYTQLRSMALIHLKEHIDAIDGKKKESPSENGGVSTKVHTMEDAETVEPSTNEGEKNEEATRIASLEAKMKEVEEFQKSLAEEKENLQRQNLDLLKKETMLLFEGVENKDDIATAVENLVLTGGPEAVDNMKLIVKRVMESKVITDEKIAPTGNEGMNSLDALSVSDFGKKIKDVVADIAERPQELKMEIRVDEVK